MMRCRNHFYFLNNFYFLRKNVGFNRFKINSLSEAAEVRKKVVKKVAAKKKSTAKQNASALEQLNTSLNQAAMVSLGVVGKTIDAVESNIEA